METVLESNQRPLPCEVGVERATFPVCLECAEIMSVDAEVAGHREPTVPGRGIAFWECMIIIL